MAAIHKVLLVLLLVQVALTLAKPYEEIVDSIDGTFAAMKRKINEKRAESCGGACEPEGCYSKKCRTSCKYKEVHASKSDHKCPSGQKCCMCHVIWRNGCAYDG